MGLAGTFASAQGGVVTASEHKYCDEEGGDATGTVDFGHEWLPLFQPRWMRCFRRSDDILGDYVGGIDQRRREGNPSQ